KTLWIRGASAALFVLGVEALLGRFSPDMAPTWPSYKVEELWVPWLGRISGTLTSGLMAMTITMIVLYWLDRLTAGWTRRRALGIAVVVLAQAAMAAANADQWIEIVAVGMVGGALATLIYATVLRFDLRIAPTLIAVYLVVGRRQCLANFLEPHVGIHVNLDLGDQLVELRIRVAAVVVVAVSLSVVARQHRLEDEDAVGGPAAPAEHVHAGIGLLQLG